MQTWEEIDESVTNIQQIIYINMFEIEFDKKQLEEALPQYKYIKTLGSGAFAKVYLVQNRETADQLALKKVSCFGMGQYEKAGAANQVRILSSLSHKNIIKVSSCLFDNSEDVLYIFMEYADSGDLNSLIEQARDRKKRIPESTVWKVINDVSEGLNYLHHNQIIHRDLKPANIFRSDKNFKIGDMNVSKVLKSGEAASTKTGSPFYTAPQVWAEDQGYDKKCDIWSLGILIYELCSLQVPYEGDSIFELVNKIKAQKNQKNLPTFYSASLNELFKKMIEIDPKKRISAEQILKISVQKLKIQTEGLDEKGADILFKTIVFPQTNQRWINLIPSSLPPKTSRINSQIHQRNTKSRSKQKNENKQPLQNNSGIFRSTERKPIHLPKSRSRSKLENNSQLKGQVLPPICKNSPQIPKKQVEKKEEGSKQKRGSSNGSRTNRKSIIESINQAKSFIADQ